MTCAASWAGRLACASLVSTLLLAVPAFAKKPRTTPPLAANEQVIEHGRFSNIHLYSPATTASSFALLLSGDGGHQQSVAALAQALVAEQALVAVVDTPRFLKQLEADGGDCVFPDGDLENLSHFVQAYARLPGYRAPLLVGYSSGATLAYASLVQAPAGLFAAGIGLGYCPDLQLKKPLCPGAGLSFTRRHDGGVDFLPQAKLGRPFLVLNGALDTVCDLPATQRHIDAIPAARQLLLAGVGHDYGADPRAVAALRAAYRRLAPASAAVIPTAPAELGDLPLIEQRVAGADERYAVIWSGDGGWAGLDKEVATALNAKGISVVGVDSLRYFWAQRTPQSVADDSARIINHYARAWGKRRAILIGYSQGADVLPFALTRLPAEARAKVALAVALGMSGHALFEFHLSNWLAANNDGPETLPEVRRIKGIPFLCVYGADDEDANCNQLKGSEASVVKLPGGHHFDGDYAGLAATILAALPKP